MLARTSHNTSITTLATFLTILSSTMSDEELAARKKVGQDLRYWKKYRFSGFAAGALSLDEAADSVGAIDPFIYARKDYASRWIVSVDLPVMRVHLLTSNRSARLVLSSRLCFIPRRYGLVPLTWIRATTFRRDKPLRQSSQNRGCESQYRDHSHFLISRPLG